MSVGQLIFSTLADPFYQMAEFYKEARQNGIKAAIWNTQFELAAPKTRNFDVAYVPLQRKLGENTFEDVGTFIPEYYAMAKVGLLPLQIRVAQHFQKEHFKEVSIEQLRSLSDQWPTAYQKLFRRDGQLKSNFELATLPFYDIPALFADLSKTYRWLRENGHPYPAPAWKLRLEEDYLAELKKIPGLSIKEDRGNTDPQYKTTSKQRADGITSTYLSIPNPHSKATTREKILHGIGNWLAPMVTLTLTLSFIGINSWAMLLAAAFATYVGNICAQQFAQFDFAEGVHRDLDWILSNKYPKIGKVSNVNLFKTLIKSAALCFVAYGAALAAGSGLLGLPFLVWAPPIELGLAMFFGGVAATGALFGLSFTMRYITGFGISDNQIHIDASAFNALEPVSDHSISRSRAIRAAKKVARSHPDQFDPSQEITAGDIFAPNFLAAMQIAADEIIVHPKYQPAENTVPDAESKKLR